MKNLPFWRLKTFNEKLNATIGFLKQYWKPLLRANLLVAGPLFVLGIGLILYYFQVFYQNLVANPDDENIALIFGMFFTLFVGGLFYGIAILAVTMVTFEFMKVSHEHPDKINDLNFIFQNTKKRFKKMFGFMILGVAANFIVSMVVQFASIFMLVLGPWAAILIFPIYVLGHVGVYAYMYVIAPTAYFQKIRTSKTIETGVKLVKGRFWQTSGMYFGAKAIQYIIITGLVGPILVGIFGYFLYNEQFGGGATIYSDQWQRAYMYLIMFLTFIFLFFNLFSNIFHVLTGAVQYFSLKEEKENNYLYSQIETFETL